MSASSPQAASKTRGSSRPGRSSVGRRPGTPGGDHSVDRRPQVGGPDRLGQEVVHAGRQAPLAVFLPRARRQGDDGQMAPRGPLPLPDRLDDLEAVQLRHVDVQEQQVEGALFRQGQRLPAVARQPHAVAPPGEQLLQELRVELVVLGHQDVQRRRGRDRRRSGSRAGAARPPAASPLARLITR